MKNSNRELIKRQIQNCKVKIAKWDAKADSLDKRQRIGLSTSNRQDMVDDLIRLESKLLSFSE